MADPTTSTTAGAGLSAVLLLVLGPKFGPVLAPLLADWLLVLGGAGFGAMHAVSKIGTASNWAACWYVLRWVGTACVLTSVLAYGITKYTGIPAAEWPGAVAFLITFCADKWRPWLFALGSRFIERKTGGAS